MTSEEAITKRLEELIDTHENIGHEINCIGWLTSALNIVRTLFPDESNIYRETIEGISSEFYSDDNADYTGKPSPYFHTMKIFSILKNIKNDIKYGLVSSIANKAIAETFDEFLEHGRAYFQEKRKMESGVICGVVFEDTIRKLCKKHNIEEAGKNLDTLISALATKGILKKVVAQRARTAASLRNQAAHAQWEEFELSDVSETIHITQELISYHLSDK